MKKLVTLAVVGGVGYITYRKAQVVFKTVPFVMTIGSKKTQGMKRPTAHQQKFLDALARRLPYTAFCEITGCKYEVHANMSDACRDALSAHLSEDH